MPSCAVVGCSNYYKGKSDSHYYRFPKDKENRLMWVELCGRDRNFNTANQRVCSRHFDPSVFQRNLKHELLGIPSSPRSKKFKHDAVPTLHLPSTTEVKVKMEAVVKDEWEVNVEDFEVDVVKEELPDLIVGDPLSLDEETTTTNEDNKDTSLLHMASTQQYVETSTPSPSRQDDLLPTCSLYTMDDILNFENEGFKNIDIQHHDDAVTMRSNVTSRKEFERWKEIYCYKTNTCFNSKYVVPVKEGSKAFRQHLVCHHGLKHTDKKKTSTGCTAQMDVTIRSVHERAAKNDKLLQEFPCSITVKGQHNHSTQSADSLGQLRVLPSTRDMFFKYFEQGMTASQAHRHHQMKMDLVDHNLCGLANRSINPNYKCIANMRTRWMKKENGGANNVSMFNAIKSYASNNQEVTIEVDRTDSQLIVVLLTPFMRRAHEGLKEAGEVVYVDATKCDDELKTTVIPLVCAGPAGAVLLGVLFTSSQDEACLARGFSMIKSCLGESAFYRRGTPKVFMTDHCEPERKALAATWPDAQLFLCTFQILQQVWQWLSEHGIRKSHCHELMAVMKDLVYADTPSSFSQQWDSFQSDPLSRIHPNFTRYLTMLIQQKAEWSVPFRAETMLQGHHTNNFCEATICILKEVLLSRCKGYDTPQLIMFMVEVFDMYLQQRLVEVTQKRRHINPLNPGKVPMDAVSPMGAEKFKVRSESNSLETHEVDLSIGMCTCINGENGVTCDHQAACAEFSMTLIPQIFVPSDRHQQWLAALTVVNNKESFIKSLCAPEHNNLSNQQEGMNIVVESNTSSHQVDNDEVSMESDIFHFNESANNFKNAVIDTTESLARTLIQVATKLGNKESLLGMRKVEECLKAAQTSDQFNSILFTLSSHNAKKSECVPVGTSGLLKGQRPIGIVSKTKCSHNLPRDVLEEVVRVKPHGTDHEV